MKTYQYNKLSELEIVNLCQRQSIDFEPLQKQLMDIRSNIKLNGDKALFEYTQSFDRVRLDSLLVSEQEFKSAEKSISVEFKNALNIAIQNVKKFHLEQIDNTAKIETTDGVFCWREPRAIDKVGLYIPGGSAPLFSTILMTVIPAQIAGCKEIVICTPPQKDGSIAPETLYAAASLNIQSVYKLGGAQAVFALSEGTESIPKVDKIFGPGNQWVAASKEMVSNNVAIDLPAGPSEVLIIANSSSNASFVASDLLSQAEHGIDSEVTLVTNDENKAKQVSIEIQRQLTDLPRQNIVKKTLDNSSILITDNISDAIDFSNRYAPEHLILAFDDFEKWLPKIRNAGSVFCGSLSCESFGDYASGTNHVLPTSGFARNYSGISVDSFVKKITFQHITKQGCLNLGPVVETLAKSEQLHAHKNAVSIRLEALSA